MELIHKFVEVLDSYFGNVCELDLIFNFDKAHYMLDELILAGSVQETSKREIVRVMKQQDDIEQKIVDERKQSKKEEGKDPRDWRILLIQRDNDSVSPLIGEC